MKSIKLDEDACVELVTTYDCVRDLTRTQAFLVYKKERKRIDIGCFTDEVGAIRTAKYWNNLNKQL